MCPRYYPRYTIFTLGKRTGVSVRGPWHAVHQGNTRGGALAPAGHPGDHRLATNRLRACALRMLCAALLPVSTLIGNR